jgi:hypothetical protein
VAVGLCRRAAHSGGGGGQQWKSRSSSCSPLVQEQGHPGHTYLVVVSMGAHE